MRRNEEIEIGQQDTVTKTFRTKIPRSTQPWDVSLASQIILRITRCEDGAIIPPLVANPNEPGADWARGLVLISIDPTVTEVPGTYNWTLVVFIGGQTISGDSGTIEVARGSGL